MLKFTVGQNTVRARGSPEELKVLRNHLMLPIANAYFMRKRGWDGKIRFFGWVTKRFPFGLWSQVKHFLKENKIEYKAFTKRRALALLDSPKSGSVTLDSYQLQACNNWLKAGGSGIVWGGAGFGKTEIAAALINQMIKRRLVSRVLFIVNTLDLLDQGAERLKARLGLRIGKIGGGEDDIRTITVASIQGLDRRIKDNEPKLKSFLSQVDMIVYDEVHHGKSEQSARLSKACPAKYRLGLSARPLFISHDKYREFNLHDMKADDARVLSFLGPIIFRVRPSQLITSGRLARPTIYLYPLGYKDWRDDVSGRLEHMGFSEARRRLIIDSKIIHNVTRSCALAATKAGETTLVVAGGSKLLGLKIYEELRDANLNVVYLHGGVKKEFRTKSRHKLVNKQLDACVATTIYDEGIDVPRLRLLVLAYGGLSPFKNEQRLGRGLREKLGANEGVVIDFMQYSNKHLRRHSYARLKQYLEEELYIVKLITKNHTPKVIGLVGKHNVVESLPDYNLFKELRRHGKHKVADRAEQKYSDV